MRPHFGIVFTIKWPYCPSYGPKTAVLQAPSKPRTISKPLQDTSSRYRPSASPAPFPSLYRTPVPGTGPRRAQRPFQAYTGHRLPLQAPGQAQRPLQQRTRRHLQSLRDPGGPRPKTLAMSSPGPNFDNLFITPKPSAEPRRFILQATSSDGP